MSQKIKENEWGETGGERESDGRKGEKEKKRILLLNTEVKQVSFQYVYNMLNMNLNDQNQLFYFI